MTLVQTVARIEADAAPIEDVTAWDQVLVIHAIAIDVGTIAEQRLATTSRRNFIVAAVTVTATNFRGAEDQLALLAIIIRK